MSRRVDPHSVLLFVAGLVLIVIGAANLFAPVAFHQANGIMVVADAGLLSETRAAGGVLLTAGVFIMVGAFSTRFAVAAAAVGATGYLAYALSRLLGIALDGVPAGGLVLAAVVESVLGLACAYSLLRRSREGARV
ncbi:MULTISPECIES: DUF4345 domain-containing protein [Nonomuraea]|uniref:DUF4345 domain-containing protein n=1 Tax=Nonomuraea salmonea TaxID=46181 RepID=A0ABV5P286_9ACTN